MITVLACLAFASACSGTAKPSASLPASGLTTKELVQRSKPAIVRIEVQTPRGPGVGTGFVLTSDGRIATNLHVIRGASEVKISLLDGSQVPLQEIVAVDEERDLAIIKVASRAPLPVLTLGNSDKVAAGDAVIAIGNPLGVLDYTVSDGLISSVRMVNQTLTVLQISAPISQGSSGGPLFNELGEVIGVATAIMSEGQNLNFGIPSNYLKPLLDRNDRLSLTALAAPPSPSRTRIERRVPNHDVSILKGCSEEALVTAIQGISEAISVGAPLYNEGNHEACFRIYEGAAIRLERELECPGLRDALGQGLLRASTQEGFTLKAWAMRDAFDGILGVVERKVRSGP